MAFSPVKGVAKQNVNRARGIVTLMKIVVEGLICEFDGWWGTDYCVAGKLIRYCHMHKVKSHNVHWDYRAKDKRWKGI